MITLDEVIAMQNHRNDLYEEACRESRMVANGRRHDARQLAAHPERGRPVVAEYEEERLTETWRRYYAYCAEVDAAKAAYRKQEATT